MAKSNQWQNNNHSSFLKGGGEMGRLTRDFDWNNTVLGPPDKWPQSLKTTLSIILNSKFPMFLWWGPELTCFYNDAYRPSLGKNGKHPSILGMPAATAWAEIWDIIKPLIDQVLADGEATWSEDQLIPIYRNGQIEDVYWTFSYSPVADESGSTTGVFVTCNETTGKVNAYHQLEETNLKLKSAMEAEAVAQRKIKENERNLRQVILQAPVAIAIFRGPEHIIEIANPSVLKLWGRTAAEVLNKPMLESRTELKSQGIKELLDAVYQTGKPFLATEFPIQLPREGQLETTYVNFVYEPLYATNGKVNGLIAIGTDVTPQFLARKKIEESEERFRTMAEGSDIMIAVSDETGNATYFNSACTKLTGRSMGDLLESGWTDLIHLADKERFLTIYLSAFEKRVPFTGEFRILSKNGDYRWLLAKGPPRFHPDGSFAGYISSCIDITIRKQAEVEKQNLTKIIEASTEFIGLAGNDTNIQYLNPAGLKKLGWETYTGRKIMDCIYPADREFALGIMPERLEKGAFQHEVRFWNEQTKEPFWIQWNGLTIKDAETGVVIGLATVSPDITERKRHEQELQAINEELAVANEMLRFSVEAAGAATWHMDVATREFIASQRLKELFGFHPDATVTYDDIIGKIPESYHSTISKATEETVTGGANYSVEYPVTGYDGKKRWVNALGKLYPANLNKNAHFSGLIIDITEQKQDELRKNDFIGMVSHELKTPLTTLTALVQVLHAKLKQSDDPFISSALDKANKQVKKMNAMINGFLNISRLESGKIFIFKQDFDLDQLIHEVIEESQLTVSAHAISFTPSGYAKVNADKDKIGSVISNLLSNAIKYSPKGTNIEIYCKKIADDIQISVTDEGIGINPQDIEKLFDRYYRVKNQNTAHISGFGIGLYLSAEIVNHHNGRIWVESQAGQGSTFYFSLPLS